MSTSWAEDHVVDGFESYDDTLERVLGYPYVYKALGLADDLAGSWLDYGCGPGKVAARFAEESQKHLYAVDESKGMIDVARKTRAHPLVSYELIRNDDLSFIPDNTLSGAMLCFVTLNLNARRRIKTILTNLYQKLKPGAPCVILDTNPASTALAFTTFQSGLRHRYNDADKRPAWLYLPNGKKLELEGYFWSQSTYIGMFEDSGYEHINLIAPTLADLPTAQLRAIDLYKGVTVEHTTEWTHPPYLIISASKSE